MGSQQSGSDRREVKSQKRDTEDKPDCQGDHDGQEDQGGQSEKDIKKSHDCLKVAISGQSGGDKRCPEKLQRTTSETRAISAPMTARARVQRNREAGKTRIDAATF
jgi:hypothetical protein